MASRKAAGAAAVSANDARMFVQLPGQNSIIATPTIAEIQVAHLAARFGLAADRARLVAALHFGDCR